MSIGNGTTKLEERISTENTYLEGEESKILGEDGSILMESNQTIERNTFSKGFYSVGL